jgi:hypothetical protein
MVIFACSTLAVHVAVSTIVSRVQALEGGHTAWPVPHGDHQLQYADFHIAAAAAARVYMLFDDSSTA